MVLLLTSFASLVSGSMKRPGSWRIFVCRRQLALGLPTLVGGFHALHFVSDRVAVSDNAITKGGVAVSCVGDLQEIVRSTFKQADALFD